MLDTDAVRDRYDRFARIEAPHRSALYAQWAAGVAGDAEARAILAGIPATHRQPPLVFAVTRMLGCGLVAYPRWAAWLRMHADAVAAECAARTLQTNEPLRCAALLPALSMIDGPVALLEVGASAGLCLYPDRYSYRYATDDGPLAVDPADGVSPVVLSARWRGAAPRLRLPEVVWRAGIDLQPRRATDAADRAWIEGLVWPGEHERAARIGAALDVVAADGPLLVCGDAVELLGEVAASAPRDATLVITTPGVLAHVPRAGRERIAAAARAAGCWITLDAPGLHRAVQGEWVVPGEWAEPGHSAVPGRSTVPEQSAVSGRSAVPGRSTVPGHSAVPGRSAGRRAAVPDPDPWPNGMFALAVDGQVIAAADPLGGIVRPNGAAWEWHPDPEAATQ
ncbi:DUF2332 domain-containing protein [Microbacterium luticocti]|uniref:DUF2332 domain-containing protein n=1 Tax=Microbacterium luticocti TaxID=451764 RepID=UPI000425C2A2|nr:DUF2332 domain-containing protein [Microbacterium luticocti]